MMDLSKHIVSKSDAICIATYNYYLRPPTLANFERVP